MNKLQIGTEKLDCFSSCRSRIVVVISRDLLPLRFPAFSRKSNVDRLYRLFEVSHRSWSRFKLLDSRFLLILLYNRFRFVRQETTIF